MNRVTVVMPMKDAERYVRAAIDSVLQSAETFEGDLEIIVVDDGSTDGAADEIAAIRVDCLKVIPNKGRGIADALNTGFSAAAGDIIMRCDADDLFERHRMNCQVAWLAEREDFAAVCGAFTAIDAAGRVVKRFACGDVPMEITSELRHGVARTSLCTFAIRREAILEAGPVRSWFESAEDLDLQFRIGGIGRVAYEPANMYHYRLHNASVTHTEKSERRQFFESMARRFAEQRSADGEDDLMRGDPPPVPDSGPRYSADEHIADLLTGDSWQLVQEASWWPAVKQAARGCRHRPLEARRWRHLAAVALRAARRSDSDMRGEQT